MTNYDFTQKFHGVYDRAIASYRAGAREVSTLLAGDDVRWLESIGSRAQDMFDYAEDATNHGEPDYDTALLVQAVRRAYFLEAQGGKRSRAVLDADTMPRKTDAARGIVWLPRIIPKAKAKLRGEMPQDMMYGCGGDRGFFQMHDIHPAEFLRLVWAHENNDTAIIDWVEKRAKAALRAATTAA